MEKINEGQCFYVTKFSKEVHIIIGDPIIHCINQEQTDSTSVKVLLIYFSFEWPRLRILSTDSKVRTTLYIVINTHHRKELLNSFHLTGHSLGLHPQTQKVRTTLYSIITAPQESTAQ